MIQRIRNYKFFLFALVLSVLFIFAGCEGQSRDYQPLTVHYIDVDQGDATLLQGVDFTILIDAGRHDANEVTPYLQKQGVTHIDLMILTHPHADHIGQADVVLEHFEVKEVWMNGDEHTSKKFETVLDAILKKETKYDEPRAGEAYTFGSALVEVVHPSRLTGHLNNGSISVRITYGDINFLFTGDAEHEAESEMIDRGHDLHAHIFHVGHHGSSTSNTTKFLNKVQPEVAIYSAGAANSYGHPHREVIGLMNNMGIDLYGTAVHGTIVVITDGKQYTISPSKSGTVSETPIGKNLDMAIGIESDCININTASSDELENIIHLSTIRISELIERRPFSSVDQLTDINGISWARLADMKEQGLICVE